MIRRAEQKIPLQTESLRLSARSTCPITCFGQPEAFDMMNRKTSPFFSTGIAGSMSNHDVFRSILLHVQNLRADRAQKSRDLSAQRDRLDQTVSAYMVAQKTTETTLEYLHGNQLLAMKPALRECLDGHEAGFASLELEPCVEDHVKFEHDGRVAKSVRLMISRLGCLQHDPGSELRAKEVPHSPEKEVHASSAGNRDIHFTLAAVVGARPPELTFASPTDTVVVEIRNGSEHDFLTSGTAGPVIGRVVLHTKFRGAKNLRYESEHFFESLSQMATLEGHTSEEEEKREVSRPSKDNSNAFSTAIPAVRFTKTLRVLGRRVEGKP